jgi:hypothetical protein
MSLINDALKRAKDAHESNPPSAEVQVEFRPAGPSHQEKGASRTTLSAMIYAAVVFTFLVLGIVSLKEIGRSNSLKAAARTQPADLASAAVHPGPTKAARIQEAPAASQKAASAAPGLGTPVTNQVVVAPAPLKLQAIFFDPARPSAIVSGETVFVGDKVRAFRVLTINRDSVSLRSGSQIKVLKLAE